MYRLSVPRNKTNIISILDNLVIKKEVDIPDAQTARILGMYTKTWRVKGFFSLYTEPLQKKTLLKVNVDNIEKIVRPGKRIEYTLDEKLLKILVRPPRI